MSDENTPPKGGKRHHLNAEPLELDHYQLLAGPEESDAAVRAAAKQAAARLGAILAPLTHAERSELLAGLCGALAIEAHRQGDEAHAAELEQLGLRALGKQPQ